MKRFILLYMLILSAVAHAENTIMVFSGPNPRSVDLKSASILLDSDESETVKTSVSLFAKDIEKVSGVKPMLVNEVPKSTIVVVGTVGSSCWIDHLVKLKKLDVSKITDGWERFVIKVVNKPFKGVEKALVIAGSDRRGTAYGLFSVSEAIGVSPWYWWGDVPVEHRENLFVSADFTSPEPSVRYRGIFINDEDWGMKTWSSNNYEKDLGDIGPKTYAKICELILRLKGNMLAPAMHECTGAFYTHPENKVVADKYGIMITTSHCEPLLFNNASKLEWDTKVDGEWNYKTNSETIKRKLDNRVREASPYENVYTLAMRGLHDGGMRGNYSQKEKVQILQNAINDQRVILKKYIDKPIEKIPQIFIPYKEAQDLYEEGLNVPEDVTLVWVDDNYGYIKRLSNPQEQKREGRAGVYYHLSYLGAPHDYLWINTTPPVLMYEQLKRAYDFGADRYWLLNVGDIKPMELGVTTFFSMAYDLEKFNFDNINEFQTDFLCEIYGDKYRTTFQRMLDNYYRLAWSRKPEFMGWEREWDVNKNLERLGDVEYSFDNHNDARYRLADYKAISDKAAQLVDELPSNLRPSFYEMVAYPMMASYQMNRKFMMSTLNHQLYSRRNFNGANWAAEESKIAYDSINALTTRYNTLLNGKWDHMMALGPGWCAKHSFLPELRVITGFKSEEVDLSPLDTQTDTIGFTLIDLARFKVNKNKDGNKARIVKGLGYDWQLLQLGEPTGNNANPTSKDALSVTYEFGKVDADSVSVTVYALPFFPIYKGKSNSFGVSIDNGDVTVMENFVKEYSNEWKDRVLRNSSIFTTKFHVDKSLPIHSLTLSCGDPGQMIQRIVIDWGGLKKTYVGPDARLFRNE
jgi:hypothetical protein